MKSYGGVDGCTDAYLLEVSGQFHAHPTLAPLKEPPVPIGQEAGWAPELVWMTWRSENSCPHWDLNSDPLVIQPVASHYTDCTILALRVGCLLYTYQCVCVYLSYYKCCICSELHISQMYLLTHERFSAVKGKCLYFYSKMVECLR
jgi:hypothetical protein